MADTENSETYWDFDPRSQEIINNQLEMISHQQEIIEQSETVIAELEHQTAIMEEQLNGFSLMINYQHTLLAVGIVFVIIAAGWSVLNKWFFRGC